MTVKATKTSLYKLVAEYASLPLMKYTTFVKLGRSRAYWLDWWGDDGRPREAYFTAAAGRARLRIGYRIVSPDYPASQEDHLSIEDLRARGMLDE